MSQFCPRKVSIDSKFNLVLIPLLISLYQKVWLSRGSLLSQKAFDLGVFTRVHKLLSVQIMKAEAADRAESGT